MSQRMQPRALPERAMRSGAHVVVHMTRRTVAYGRPQTGTRLQRVIGTLLLVPALVLALCVVAVLFAVLFVLAVILTLVLASAALVVRRRLPRRL